MAERLGLDEGSLCRWESGSRQPSRWMADRLISLLDAIDRDDAHIPRDSGLSFYDLTRWRRRFLLTSRSPQRQQASGFGREGWNTG
jgi:hypothetical protein